MHHMLCLYQKVPGTGKDDEAGTGPGCLDAPEYIV